MAYVSQEMKKEKEPKIKAILKKYGLKGSLSVKHHSTLQLTIQAGKIDFIKNYIETGNYGLDVSTIDYLIQKQNIDVNPYYIKEHFSDIAEQALSELKDALFEGHWDDSDIMTDYFSCAFYVRISIGKWNRGYKLI